MPFTKLALDRLRPKDARYDVPEKGVSPDRRGLKLWVYPSGRKVFTHRFKLDGKTEHRTLGEYGDGPDQIDIEEAHRRLEKAKRYVRDGVMPPPFVEKRSPGKRRPTRKRTAEREKPSLFERNDAGNPPPPPDNPHSVAFVAYEYFWRFVIKERHDPDYVARILDREVIERLGTDDARTIKPRRIVEFLDRIVDRGSPVMANRVSAILSQMFLHGIERGTIEDTPVRLLRPPGGSEESRDRALSDAELRAVNGKLPTSKASAAVRHALRVLMFTGTRREDIAGAQWSEIDLDAGTWFIPGDGSKKRPKDRTVPLTAPVVAEFRALRKLNKKDSFVMPAPGGGRAIDPKAITRAVARSQEHFGIPHWTPHDLRRTVRTGLGRLGIDPMTAERAIGHQVGSRVERTYDRYDYSKEICEALTKWSDHLVAVLAGKTPADGEAK
jgi:integrase